MAASFLTSKKKRPIERERLRTNPYFLRLISKAFLVFTAVVCLTALLFYDSPLSPPAEPATPPNPAKSAWFLLWVQELVSYSSLLVYLIVFFGVALCFLPHLLSTPAEPAASWFKRQDAPAWLPVMIGLVCVLALTAYAAFFRGENWQSTFPWPF